MALGLLALGLLVDLGTLTLGALPLEAVPLEAVPLEAGEPVYPTRGNGFAAAIVGAVVALGLLVLMMMFISSKPRNRRR